MEDSADIELYEEIVGNPAYSSSSDTSKSDPVSFQFKEPRLTECREEDFFARARSLPDPRIISHALAGKNSQEPRSCDTFVECGSSGREFYDNSTILAPLQIHLYSTHLRQWCPMWSPLMELPYAISVRYWRPTWGQRQTHLYSTTLRHVVCRWERGTKASISQLRSVTAPAPPFSPTKHCASLQSSCVDRTYSLNVIRQSDIVSKLVYR